MTNVDELSRTQATQLRECYRLLHELSANCTVPAVRAGARLALAEVYAALEGQGMEFDLYSNRWLAEPAADALAS